MLVVCKNAIYVIGNAETDIYTMCHHKDGNQTLSHIHTCQPPAALH